MGLTPTSFYVIVDETSLLSAVPTKALNLSKPFVVGAMLLSSATTASACGDKLMLLVGTARFRQVYGSSHPASILAYTHADSAVANVIQALERQPDLQRAGHKFFVVKDSAELEQALKTGRYDVLLVDIGDAQQLMQRARSAPSRPTILPVISKSNHAEAAAGKTFHSVLKAPDSSRHYLSAIDDALETRIKDGSLKPER